MLTTETYLNTLTVVRLKEMLKTFNYVGVSKMRKSELVATILLLTDVAHDEAIAFEAAQMLANTSDVVTAVKATRMSAEARTAYYSAQRTAQRWQAHGPTVATHRKEGALSQGSMILAE